MICAMIRYEGKMPIIPDKNQNSSSHFSPKRLSDLSSRSDINRLSNENARLESELHLTLEEIAHLQNALANANMKLTVYKNASKKAQSSEKSELNAIAEELKEVYIPLNTISKYCELLLSESIGLLGTIQQKFVERISDSASQINELFDGIQEIAILHENALPLENSNPKDKTNPLESPACDLHIILEDILACNASLLQEKQIVLQMEVPDELPKVLGSKEDLTGIIELVLMNALNITPKDGSICITAFLEKILAIQKVTLKIRDGGPGIPTNALKQLFPYQREIAPGGTSGLALDNNEFAGLIDLIQLHGCKFKLSNAIGFGTIFEVTFDCAH
jgi:signal transduction histidine kinase